MGKLLMSYPSKKIGGVQTLIYRIIKENSINYKSIIIDYKDGLINMLLTNNNIDFKLINYEKKSKELLKQNLLLIDVKQYNYLTFIAPDCNGYINCKLSQINRNRIFYWIVHPENMLSFYTLVGKINSINHKKVIVQKCFKELYNESRKFLLDNIENGKLFFMDYENFWYNNYIFNLNLKSKDVKFLPIPIEVYSKNKRIKNKSISNKIDLCWLGTLVPWKAIILKKIILDINKLVMNYEYNINFNIIGNGESINDIKKFIIEKKIKYKINFKGILLEDRLNEELLKNDILFAMGTSALEGAKLGIPTILADPCSFIPKIYKYNWIFETCYYTLGRIITKDREKEIQKSGYSLVDIISQYVNNHEELSNKCFNYCKNHDISNVYKKMNQYFEEAKDKKCKTTYNDIVNIRNRNLICKISDLRNKIKNCLFDKVK